MSEMAVRRLGPADVAMAQAQVAAFWDVMPDETVIGGFLAQSSNVFLSAEADGAPMGQLIGYILPRWDQAPGMGFISRPNPRPNPCPNPRLPACRTRRPRAGCK